MDWYVIDKNYVAYLRGFDDKVGQVEYGDRFKLHIGIIVEIDEFKYYVPVSSPKPKHERMGNGLDFQKIVDPDSGRLYAVININNMIPVPDKYITQLKYNEIDKHRIFEKEKVDYIYLLQTEKTILAKRCCDFTLLQEKSLNIISNTKSFPTLRSFLCVKGSKIY